MHSKHIFGNCDVLYHNLVHSSFTIYLNVYQIYNTLAKVKYIDLVLKNRFKLTDIWRGELLSQSIPKDHES